MGRNFTTGLKYLVVLACAIVIFINVRWSMVDTLWMRVGNGSEETTIQFPPAWGKRKTPPLAQNRDGARNITGAMMNRQGIAKPLQAGPAIGANGAWQLNPDTPFSGHITDINLCIALEQLFMGKDVLDLGCGMGSYGRCFLRKKTPLLMNNPAADKDFFHSIGQQHAKWWNESKQQVKSWTGYDGSPNIEEVTMGYVKHMDLSQPQTFDRKWDWVMSLEVGEHIPKEFEDTYISNIIKPVRTGLVLSWSVRGQGGLSHINELNNTEVVRRMAAHGFVPDVDQWRPLREKATLFHFKNTLMVFKPMKTE